MYQVVFTLKYFLLSTAVECGFLGEGFFSEENKSSQFFYINASQSEFPFTIQ